MKIESILMVEQFRFPKTKKNRIIKKWCKDKKNWRPMITFAHMANGSVICHPVVAERISSVIAKQEREIFNRINSTRTGMFYR